ncbi:MAG: hypothetical protein M1815_003632 [Lichina confinis]|nr:MAG: hypothetical protein M1815_003632 [Lichina confinis]
MKFVKELEEGLVPEWRAKYFDYRTGKKKLKAVARALRGVSGTPRTLQPRSALFTETSLFGDGEISSPYQTVPPHSFLNRPRFNVVARLSADRRTSRDTATLDSPRDTELDDRGGGGGGHHRRRTMASHHTDGSLSGIDETAEHHSFSPSRPRPVTRGSFASARPSTIDPGLPPPALILPGPALDPGDGPSNQRPSPLGSETTMVPGMSRITFAPAGVEPLQASDDGSEVGRMHPTPSTTAASMPPGRGLFMGRRRRTSTVVSSPLSVPRRANHLNSVARDRMGFASGAKDAPLDPYREFDLRRTQFFDWMDEELKKIDGFYKEKEDEASQRLRVLKDQLREMRERRVREALLARHARTANAQPRPQSLSKGAPPVNTSFRRWVDGVLSRQRPDARSASRSTSHADEHLPFSAALSPRSTPERHARTDARRDFVRRKSSDAISHRQAKRKLKAALSEYYRGLELLKSYALLNRTAFRKMNKKHDKLVQELPSGRYVAEKVNTAWFVQSAVLESNMRTVEDLYATYIEHGNHKVAVGKLRTRVGRPEEYHGSTFRNGLLLAGAALLGIQGLVAGTNLILEGDPLVSLRTSYLLQLYGGYFLALLLFLLFCLACRLWTEAKINYVFIFEFDTRHHLDWRQLSELPCLFLFLGGLCLWLNFALPGPEQLFIWYPVILVALTTFVFVFPGRALYRRSRLWWLYSQWRLLWSGWFPVEFRDFFLGDMYCSQTYFMGNIALFACLYAHDWVQPVECNSSRSRALGVLTAVPALWRALQCLRRYADTRNRFPHLANGFKYLLTIANQICLSSYRIDMTTEWRAAFITVATVNAIYSSVWDVAFDWSLGNPWAEYPFLRHGLGYKQVWMYYVAMVVDPILRFNWIFYVIFTKDIQHSALLSFVVSLSEVLRRGIWTLFRVENEHCTNVGRFRASRDIPLPYDLASPAGPVSMAADVTEDGAIAAGDGKASAHAKSPKSARPSYQAMTPGAATMATVTTAQGTPPTAGTDLERATTQDSFRSGHMRRRQSASASAPRFGPHESPILRGFSRVGNLMASAHAQDFERRQKYVLAGEQVDDRDGRVVDALVDPDSSDDDDEVVELEEGEEEEEEEERKDAQTEGDVGTGATPAAAQRLDDRVTVEPDAAGPSRQ